jgi:hypothetical protein
MRRPRFALLAAMLAVACSDTSGPALPAELAILSGTTIAGEVATPAEVSVRVTDVEGRPIEGIAVQWAVGDASGSVAGSSTSTGSTGTAAMTWTFGTVAGTQTLTVTVDGLSPATVTATAVAGPPATATADATLCRPPPPSAPS